MNLVGIKKIAIDGPSGTGKSSTSKSLALKAGWKYLDTGALYRMATVIAMRESNFSDLTAFELLEVNKFEVSLDPNLQFFKINSEDVSDLIRSVEVTNKVSEIAAMANVRKFLLTLQRSFIDSAKDGIVVEGRDIGSTVIPDADFKIYLDADLEVRSERRSSEISDSDQNATRESLNYRDEFDSNRDISPLQINDDAHYVNSTFMSLDETRDFIWELLETNGVVGLTKIAIIGRPNVGKSSLVNRLTGRSDAITEDLPGITRDQVLHSAEWNSREFILVDTGGWESGALGLSLQVTENAERAIKDADVVAMVVDCHTGLLDQDSALVNLVRKSGKPTFLIVNKVDNENDESIAHSFWNLGLGEPHFISALHGRGSGDLLDALVSSLPTVGSGIKRDGIPSIAIIGKPNVGKSSLLNSFAGNERSIVDDAEGTTRDPIDELIEIDEKTFRFVDTAGIRRRAHQSDGADYYSILRSERALDQADLAIIVIDASKTITEQDLRLVSMADDSGKALVIAMNKWDLVEEERRIEIEKEIDRGFSQVEWAERINLSAKTGWHKNRLIPAINKALDSWNQRIPTSRLNAVIGALVAAYPLPIRGGKQAKIQFATQASTSPPTFVIFATEFIEGSYRRFIERRLREEFGFIGSPIRISVRLRNEKR